MNDSFWDRFPKTAKVNCIELKDKAQERIARETRGMSPDQLYAYFLASSHRFRHQIGRAYPEVAPSSMAVRESSKQGKRT